MPTFLHGVIFSRGSTSDLAQSLAIQPLETALFRPPNSPFRLPSVTHLPEDLDNEGKPFGTSNKCGPKQGQLNVERSALGK